MWEFLRNLTSLRLSPDWGKVREWTARTGGLLGRSRRDADLREELQLHAELAAEDERRRAGIGDGTELRTLRYGGQSSALETLRDQRSLPWLSDIGRDARYAWRGLRRSPTFTAVVLLTLTIGIGANTAIFAIVNSVLIRPLPYPQAERLVAVWHSAPGAVGLASVSGDLRLSSSMYFTYAENNHSFQNFGIWFPRSMTVTGVAEPEDVRAVVVSDGTLQALAVPPALGRLLSQEDQTPNGPRRVMLGYGYWKRRFGGAASVIGRTITVDSSAREIVGVMPEGFRIVTASPDVIAPMALDRARQSLSGFGYEAIARLTPGVTIDQASADVARMVPIWMRSWPAAPGVNPNVYEAWRIGPALRPLKNDVVGNAASALWVLMGTIGIVLIIACANVASLLLVRTESRQQELAVRAALGAGRRRIIRGLLVESMLLALAGGAMGLIVARIALRSLVALGPSTLPRLTEISLDWRALGFTLAISMAAALVFGLIPAMRYAGLRVSDALRSVSRSATHGREQNRVRSTLVVVQVALALVLLVSSGLMIRSFQALRAVAPGFTEPDRLQTVQISIPTSLVREPERAARMQQAIVDKLAAIPGVESAAFSTQMPMAVTTPDWDAVFPEGKGYPEREVPPLRLFKRISPGLLRTSGTKLIAGRDFTWPDLYDAQPYILVSENLAREFWGTPAAALGKRVRTLPKSPWREVIGVVQDVFENGAHEAPPAIVYWPTYGESPYRAARIDVERSVTFVIRSAGAGSDTLLGEVRRAVWSVSAGLSLASEQTMQQVYDASMARTSFTLVLLAIAAAMALTLGVVGIYGVISYAVSQKTREIGIRLALGAQHSELKRMFVRHGLELTAGGAALGLVAALGLTRLMSAVLFGVSPFDPVTYLIVPLILLAVTLAASYLPARKASRVDPVEALKAQ